MYDHFGGAFFTLTIQVAAEGDLFIAIFYSLYRLAGDRGNA
jgi:hypothetical protein